ncbi:hypothetical protein LINGRAHAP2_LOCUS29190, partial [Linum grandiflorum]
MFPLFSIPTSRFHRMHPPVQCRSRIHPSLIHHCLKFPFVMSCRKWILRTVSVLVTLLCSLIT